MSEGFAAHRSWFGIRLPAFFQAPPEPRSSAPIRYDDAGPARFTLRVIFGATRFTLPAGGLLILSQVGEALVPVIVGLAIDEAIATGDPVRLAWWLVVLAVDFAVLSFAFRFGSRMGLYGMQTVQHRLRMTVTDRLLHPAGSAHGHSRGAALSIATSDTLGLATTMQLGVYPFGELAALVFSSAMLFTFSWQLGVAAIVGAALVVATTFLAGRPLRERVWDQQELVAEAVGQAADLLAGYRVLKGLGAGAEAASRYRRTSRASLGAALRASNAEGVFVGAMDGVTAVFTALMTVLAGMLALDGELGVGELVATVGLIQYLIGPLTELPQSAGAVWAGGLACAERVLSILQAPEVHAREDGPSASPSPGPGVPVLEARVPGLELRVAPGEIVGVAADQATGDRLARLLAAGPRGTGCGTARLDGVPIDALGVDSWRRCVLVAPHRAELFDGTLGWNLDTPDADGTLVGAALHAAACDDILASMPEGLDTPVGEGGQRLSGGQRQRVALARAYAAAPPVLVLCDPTTAVDAATEAAVASRLRGARGMRSTIVVASSPALLAVCDRVVSDDGDRP